MFRTSRTDSKTPLATLAIAVKKQAPASEDLQELVVLMDRRIRHHLGRARSAALSGPVRMNRGGTTRRGPRARAAKVNDTSASPSSTTYRPTSRSPASSRTSTKCSENSLKNAFEPCQDKVAVGSSQDEKRRSLVEDDGPGLSPEKMAQAMQAGRRLDENSPGFGLACRSRANSPNFMRAHSPWIGRLCGGLRERCGCRQPAQARCEPHRRPHANARSSRPRQENITFGGPSNTGIANSAVSPSQ